MADPAARFAFTLLEIEGIGRVTASRLLHHFEHVEELRDFPHEQLLHRIKGAPNAQELVRRLRDPDTVARAAERADERLRRASEKNVQILIQNRQGYPPRLVDLDRSDRPVHLFLYGPAALLSTPTVGIFGSAPLGDRSFEIAQHLVDACREHAGIPATGLEGGFDKALQERAAGRESGHPTLILPACGLARLPRPLRPVATQALRSGSAMVSPFAMDHGPFDHDRKERTLLQAAHCDPLLFLEPAPDSAEDRALRWATGHRSVFVRPGPERPVPDGARTVDRIEEIDQILDTVEAPHGPPADSA